MKYVSSVVLLLFCSVVFADEKYFCKLDSLYSEPACSEYGGICTFAVDCPQLAEVRGLCRNQQRQGVECCYGLSIRETRCRKRGGECKPSCNPRLTYTNATDCGVNEKCCILVI